MAGPVCRYWDPEGRRYGLPTWPWGLAPDGYATRDQLAAAGLKPQQPIAAQVMWRGRRGDRVAYLYLIERAGPLRARSAAQAAALELARRRRRVCPECGIERDYYLSTALGVCTDCADGLPAAA